MNTSPKLQRAGRAFLLRLVAENGPEEAARVLRDLAAEIDDWPDLIDEAEIASKTWHSSGTVADENSHREPRPPTSRSVRKQ